MDSIEVPVYGRQEHSEYNGHFESTCYHPLLLFNREGGRLDAKLRPGDVHSATNGRNCCCPRSERQQTQGKEVAFRGEAAFAEPELYEALKERELKYAIRLVKSRRTAHPTCPVLLVAAGGEPLDAALFASILRKIAALLAPAR